MTNRKSLFAQISDLSKVPGNKGPIVRLCLVAATLIFGLVLTFLALSYTTGGLGDFLIAILTGVLTTIMAAALIWGFAKWAAFIFPKSLALANRFWNSLYALGIFALAIKAMTWIYLLLMPVTLYGLILSPLYLLVSGLSLMGSEVLAVAIFALLCIGALAFMILLDVCHLMCLPWKQVLHSAFQKVAGKTRKVFADGKG